VGASFTLLGNDDPRQFSSSFVALTARFGSAETPDQKMLLIAPGADVRSSERQRSTAMIIGRTVTMTGTI
jgi:hypothetical protein